MASYQIRLVPGGPWHRRGDRRNERRGERSFAACGEPILGAFSSREYSFDGELCPVCHTEHEINTGEMIRIERDALLQLEYDEAAVSDFESDTPTAVDEITEDHVVGVDVAIGDDGEWELK